LLQDLWGDKIGKRGAQVEEEAHGGWPLSQGVEEAKPDARVDER